MIIPVADERALSLRNRVHRWRKAKLIDDAAAKAILERFPTDWRSNGLLAQVVAFGLTGVGVALFAAFWQLIVESTIVAAVVAIVLAEVLIRGQQWWSTGVESALWLGGLFAFIGALPGNGRTEALLLFAAACVAGVIRLRQPWFAALALIFVTVYLEAKPAPDAIALFLGIGVALIALALLHKQWSRPSTEWILIALLVVAPPCAYFGSYRALPKLVNAAIFAALMVIFIVSGLRRRHHAPLVAAAICVAFVAAETHDFLPLVDEARLAIGGAALLLLAAIVSRALRGRTFGLVATPPPRTDADELLDLGGAIVATPQQPANAPEGRPQGDGGFGGAGATGGF